VVRLAGGGRLLGPGKQDMTERVLLMHGLGTEDDPCCPACTRRPLDPGAATPGLWREYVSEVTSQTARAR
jgi:hypothetical protein